MASAFFWASKLIWALISPDVLLGLGLVCVWLLLLRKKVRTAAWLLGVELVVFAVIGMLPVADWVYAPLEMRFQTNPELPDHVHGIIVLGGAEDPLMSSIWKQVEMTDSAERLMAFVGMARRFPDAKWVFSGGSSGLVDQVHKGADCITLLFQQQGLDPNKLVLERESRNTYENVLLTKKLVEPQPDENWIVITSAFHMPRTIGIFNKAQWRVIPWPVDHRMAPGVKWRIQWDPSGHLYGLKFAVKEWVGLIAYYATGKTDTLFPG